MTMPVVKSYFLLLLSLPYFVITAKLHDGTLIEIKDGKIRGHVLESENGRDYYAFQEIPYAAPPVGENRLQLPKKVSSWKGVLNATKNTKICYQGVSQYKDLEISEDCLYINVYTPVNPTSKSRKLPVLVWIHGGAYAIGSGAFEKYGPKYIIDHGVVVVTFNYRLGPFGFVTTEDDAIPANIGLKDQKFALEWVHENIHHFAGDADQVTIVGQSAGSDSVGLHVLGRKNNGRELFRAAIMQSGAPLMGMGVSQTAKDNLFNCGRILDKHFVSNDSRDLLRVLQEASAAEYFAACNGATSKVLEKKGDFSHPPFQSLKDGQLSRVPILMGFASEESLMSALSPNVSTLVSLDNDPAKLVPASINMSPENRSIAGQLLKEIYTKDSFEKDIGAYCRWSSDGMITPDCKYAELASSHVPVFFYQFSYYGELGQGPTVVIPGAGRVAHAEDLHYMWDDGSNSDLSKFPEEDRLTLHRFVKMWTNFVKYLNPTPENDPLLDGLKWPTTDSESLRYLNFNDTLEILEYPRQYRDVRKVLDYYMQPPFIYY